MNGSWKKPAKLARGDRVALVAPASAFNREDFNKGVARLRDLGLEPVYDDTVFSQHLYFAGTDRQRAERLVHYLKDDSVRAVICVRGGYGSARLLPYLSQIEWGQPKVLIGSSDVTALLTFFTSGQHWVTFHGPMVAGDIARGRVNATQWSTFLEGRAFPAVIKCQSSCWRPGRGRGILYGGCLSILCSLLGTKTRWRLDAASDIVLFLEDIRCKPYQIDRMLTQLIQSGLFDRVRGLILGEMIECDSTAGADLESVILGVMEPFSFPVIFGVPSGHTTKESLILPFGVPVELNAEQGIISFSESPVTP
ncbi:MAG TPA: LD-carboxypeptidase [Acidobacteriota bacterium]|nr:LD-carboxypeptidase [Acidobacteriota bacterium]